MTIYSNFLSPAPTPCAVALGCFDGVHRGHAAVLSKARELAADLGCTPAALSFTQPPRNFFVPNSVSLLTSPEEKAARIEALGIERLWHIPFDEQISAVSPEDFFFKLLAERLRAVHLICGFNYTFGARAEGNVALLDKLCRENGIGLTVLPPVSTDGAEVSSSAIRKAVTEGKPELAPAALGRPYSLRASVVDGQKLARRLGFPTVNQIFPASLTVPRYGVYVSRIRVPDQVSPFFGITNVGTRPTVNGTLLCAETHLFCFEGDLYGKEIEVEFLHFMRPERKFGSLDELTRQVEEDIQTAKKKIASYPFDC